jgi:hypothetical protein
MCAAQYRERRLFEKQGKYRIVVQGRIDESWSDRLAGLCITTGHPEDNYPTTVLMGPLRDQTQLSGVLNSLYDLHLSILLVEHIEEKQPGAGG